MINLSECEIASNWDYSKPYVSIFAIAYNHIEFIEACLDSILEQKTNFPFELIIHDDSSIDGTEAVIREYEEKFPNIIKAIYEIENQFQKGVDFISDIIYPVSKGKYVAICECDDRWCNSNKLQMQFDYLETHNNCSMCTHNTLRHNLLNGNETKFNNWEQSFSMSEEQILFGWNVHTSSYFMRRELAFTDVNLRYWFGDYIMLTLAMSSGMVWYFPEIMSVYNFNNGHGVTYKNLSNKNRIIEKESLRTEYLNKYNAITKYRFNNIVKERIEYNNIYIMMLKAEQNLTYADYKRLKISIKENRNGWKRLFTKKLKLQISNYLVFRLIEYYKRMKNEQ